MSEMITSYLNSMSAGYFVCQTATVFMLFLFGCLIVFSLNGGSMSVFEYLLSFPVGISAYSLSVFVILILNIPVGRMSVTVMPAAIAIICLIFIYKKSMAGKTDKRIMVFCIITALCIAVISTSGLLAVSISNDSLYYYSMYPSAIVHFGELRKQFNVFLTDVGQTSATLNTLPFLYGFNEAFGIQWFLNINTLLIIMYALWEKAAEGTDNRSGDKKDIKAADKTKVKITAAVLITAGVLVSSMPYVIMSRWAMSNTYFMCFIFICAYTARRYSGAIGYVCASCMTDETGDTRKDNQPVSLGGRPVIQGILFAMMAFLRMEGCIAALILLLCFSTLKGFSNRQLFVNFLLPVLTLSLLYDIKIFHFMKIDAPYTFLTRGKALIQLAALAAAGVYVLFIRGKVSMIEKDVKLLIPTGLILINAALFVYDRALYIENTKAFIANISNQSGWGMFPMLIIGVYVMCLVVSRKDKWAFGYEDLCFAAYFLTALAVSFARGDALRENIGDSGNRVMLQGILLAFYAAAVHVIGLLNTENSENGNF